CGAGMLAAGHVHSAVGVCALTSAERQDTWQALIAAGDRDDAPLLEELRSLAALDPEQARAVARQAASWIEALRHRGEGHWQDQLLRAYGLEQAEGLQLMRLAEALPRTPDAATARALIRDCLPGHRWWRSGWPGAGVGAGLE